MQGNMGRLRPRTNTPLLVGAQAAENSDGLCTQGTSYPVGVSDNSHPPDGSQPGWGLHTPGLPLGRASSHHPIRALPTCHSDICRGNGALSPTPGSLKGTVLPWPSLRSSANGSSTSYPRAFMCLELAGQSSNSPGGRLGQGDSCPVSSH
jgi:hypothetical protein